ncbi:MAG: PQQ-binding-like beta-propeller repeat protein [Acidobacteriota bacterium]|nr:PQQ-binding-like beta-propeller repeat protein [Acidobacteriota bacterium]
MNAGRQRFQTRRARLQLLGGGIVVLAVAIALGGYLYEQHRTGSVFPHPHAPFIPQNTQKPSDSAAETFVWPNYGYTKDHLRNFPAPATLRPPFKELWMRSQGALLEFPPVIYGEHIFQLADDGVLATIDRKTGNFVWVRKIGALSASTPAVTSTTVFATLYSRVQGVEAGRVVALDAANGNVRWARDLPSPSESSPLVDSGKVFFGSQDGTVYALDERTGATVWTYHAGGSVKASPTLKNGVLYFGDYGGNLQAVSERTGHLIWRSGSEGALLGSGTFYSTAAVAYGRVYLGNTDGRIYAYDQRSGSLDWAVQTGAYVYASPAVADAPGLGPTIYLGSYDGNFYAINARTGHVDWTYNGHGRISGSATIVGRVVYFADLGTRETTGLDISSGHAVFHFPHGSFDPVIADQHTLYLTGYGELFALAPAP